MNKEKKSQIIKDYGEKEADTGSVDVQVAILSERIRELTDHLRLHHKDTLTRVGLLNMVGRRRRLLNYVARIDVGHYRQLIGRLGLRR